MLECEYSKFGCIARLSNNDHLQSHLSHQATAHLKLLSSTLDSEVNENKALNQKVQQMGKTIKDLEGKVSEYDGRFKDLENKISELMKSGVVATPSISSASRDFKSPGSSSPSLSSVSSNGVEKAPIYPSKERSTSSFSTSSSTPRSSAVPSPQANYTPTKPSLPPSFTKLSSGSSSSVTPRSSAPTTQADSPSTNSRVVEPPAGYEKAILWGYDSITDEWTRSAVIYKMEKSFFAEGALRNAHKVEIKSVIGPADTPPEAAVAAEKTIKAGMPTGLNVFGDKYVSKISKKPVPAERYFEDVKMQAICAELGAKFNQKGCPKPIQFLPAWVLELPKNGYCGLEPFIEGEFIKLNTNYGVVLSDRNTPQAFSHFTWEASNHSVLVIDLQGVKDFYTDPQIHTKDGKGFGLGNLGMNGIDRFLKTHKCNAICQMLSLPMLNLAQDNKKKPTIFKGTMKVPYIEDQLSTDTGVRWEGPSNFSKGEFQCVQTLTGHDDRVVSLCVGGKYLFSGTCDGTIKAWNINTYALETTINAHRKSVESMCANATLLFSASSDHSIKVWDLNTLECTSQLRDHVGEVNCVVLTDKTLGYLISASFDKNIKVWNVRTLKCQNNLEGHTKAIKSLAVSGAILFSGSNDGSIMVWNLKYMSCLFTIDAHDVWIKSLAVHDKSLYSGAFDYLVKEWDIITFNNTATLSDHNDDVLSLLATDKFLVSASQDRSILLWDYNTKKVVYTIKGHRSGVQALATDGKHIFSGSDDYTVKIWKWVSS